MDVVIVGIVIKLYTEMLMDPPTDVCSKNGWAAPPLDLKQDFYCKKNERTSPL